MSGYIQLLLLSIAPVAAIAIYIYVRDKYEREPVKLLLKALLTGAVITVPILFVEEFFSWFYVFLPLNLHPAWNAFIVAALTEEFFKFLAFYSLIWKNPNFNEKFDGIVYAVYISLGFAAVENVLYVFDSGIQTGIIRMFTAVPAHALFGVAMGFYFGVAKFYPRKRRLYMKLALIIPVMLHGIYDYILMAKINYLLIVFVAYLISLWIFGFKKLNYLSAHSIFRKKKKPEKQEPSVDN